MAGTAGPRQITLIGGTDLERTDAEDAFNWAEHLACGWRFWTLQAERLDQAEVEAASEVSAKFAALPEAYRGPVRRRMSDRAAMCRREADKTLDLWRPAARVALELRRDGLRLEVQQTGDAALKTELLRVLDDLAAVDAAVPGTAAI